MGEQRRERAERFIAGLREKYRKMGLVFDRQKNFGTFTPGEAAEQIAYYESLPDDAFPMMFEQDNGVVAMSREELIEEIKRNICDDI